MIASLPMYVWPELAEAHDRYWDLIRERLEEAGIDAPELLSQEATEIDVWTDPGLVLSQTCGMPYRTELRGSVELVGTPDFGVEGCAPGYYRSVIVVRADDPRTRLENFSGGVFAFNRTDSQSGYAAMYTHMASGGFWFERQLGTGRHADSAVAVADGKADIASIDAVSWRFITRYGECSSSLRVLDWTEPSPGLPYIAAAGTSVAAIFAAVAGAIDALSPEDRDLLGIRSLVQIPEAAYMAVPNPP